MRWINFVKQPPKESGSYFVKGCHLPGQFEWDGEYLIDWRGEPLEDIDEDIEYLDESPSSDPAEVLELRQWKKEAMELLNPIMEYGRTHPDIKLGSSVTEFVLNRAKAVDALVKALEWYADKDNYTADNGEFSTAWRDQMDYKAVKALKTYQDEMGKGK